MHGSLGLASRKVDPKKRQGNQFNCEVCQSTFDSQQKLKKHINEQHIHDNWPDSGSKRDMSMIKTSSISEPKKKKTAYDQEMKERSDNMDKKILEKRKKEEMNEILERTKSEEKKTQQENKQEQEKKRKTRDKNANFNVTKNSNKVNVGATNIAFVSQV